MNLIVNLTGLKTIAGLFAVAMPVLLVGCAPNSSPQAKTADGDSGVAIVPGETPSDAAKAKMLEAKEALFTTLSGRLMEAMGSEGPAAAIAVCQQEAPQIAAAVSEEQGLQIGRTGVRLRNPNNVPPAWAEPLVNSRTDTPAFVKLSNGDAAALLPIKLPAQCLMCHGPEEQIAPDVQAQLAKLYPNDQATGFKEGELRGWLWVELPNG